MNGSAVRKRIPFVFNPANDQDSQLILDEQEQAQLVESIKADNATSNKHIRIALLTALGLSALLHVIYWFSGRDSPLFAIFPPSSHDQLVNVPLSISGILAYVAILVHLNLSLIVFPRHIVVAGFTIRAIGFMETFVWCVVAPAVSVYAGKAWQTTAWWCISGIMTGVVYVTHGWIEKGDQEIVELEELQYRAPGA